MERNVSKVSSCLQFKLLFPRSFIGQFFHTVGENRIWKGRGRDELLSKVIAYFTLLELMKICVSIDKSIFSLQSETRPIPFPPTE